MTQIKGYITTDVLPQTFGLFILYVQDWQQAIDFYKGTLEWSLLHNQENEWAEFETQGVRFALHGSPKPVAAVNTQLSFFVQDIDASLAALQEKGVRITQQPETVCEGTRCASFADPFGNEFHLTGA